MPPPAARRHGGRSSSFKPEGRQIERLERIGCDLGIESGDRLRVKAGIASQRSTFRPMARATEPPGRSPIRHQRCHPVTAVKDTTAGTQGWRTASTARRDA